MRRAARRHPTRSARAGSAHHPLAAESSGIGFACTGPSGPARGASTQPHDDQDAPFVADTRQYGTDGTAILAVAIGKLDGHLSVLQYQICAFLRIASSGNHLSP